MVTNTYRISKRRKNILRFSPVSYYLRTPKGINVCKHTATATYHHFHDLHQLSCDIPDLLHPTLFEKRLILNDCISISKMSPLQFQFHVMHWKYVGSNAILSIFIWQPNDTAVLFKCLVLLVVIVSLFLTFVAMSTKSYTCN